MASQTSRPPKTPPYPHFGAPSASLQGLERVIHDLSQRYPESRPSASSKASSTTSDVNKPLPPEPPLPLFSTPSPGCTISPQSLSPFSLNQRRALSPSSLAARRPLSAISTSPSSIVESYICRAEPSRIDHADTPLPAPRAQGLRSPSMQEERLQSFETFDPDRLTSPSEISLGSYDASGAELQGSKIQRNPTVAYHFYPPEQEDYEPGREEQIIFQAPVWESQPERSTEGIAARYRDTLFPSPFDDDDPGLSPTIPELQPLPTASLFSVPATEYMYDPGPTPTIPVPPVTSFRRSLARQSRALSHDTSYSASSSRDTPPVPGIDSIYGTMPSLPTVATGSQTSWERSDDNFAIQRNDSIPEQTLQTAFPKSKDFVCYRRSPRPQPVHYSTTVSGEHLLAKRPRSSLSRPVSDAPFPEMLLHAPSPDRSSYDTDQPSSHFSDDSEDGGEGGKERRSNPLKVLKNPFKSSIGVRESGKTGKGTPEPTQSPPPLSKVLENKLRPLSEWSRAAAKQRSSLHTAASKLDDELGHMYDTLQRFSFDANKFKNITGPSSASGHHRTESGQSNRSPPAPVIPDVPSRPPMPVKSQTWVSGGASAARHAEDDDDDGDKGGWFARRRKRKEDAKREKWRQDLKSKIKLVQIGP